MSVSGAISPDDAVLNRKAAAKFLGVHPTVLVRYVHGRGLPGHKIGRDWRFLRSEIIAWVAAQGSGKVDKVA